MKCDYSSVRRCSDSIVWEECFARLTRDGKVSYVLIKQEWCVDRWQ